MPVYTILRVALLATIASTFVVGLARAQDLCSLPVQPLCSTEMATTTSDADRMRCVEDVRRYHETLVEYRECLKGSVADAEKRVDQAAGIVACMESGRTDCGAETKN